MDGKYNQKFEFGIALSIFALPLSWSVSQILGKELSIITDLLMILALILLFNFKQQPILMVRKIEIIYIMYHSVVLIYILFCEGKSVTAELIYNGYIVIAFVLLITQCRKKDFSKLLNYFCILGGIVIFITFIYATDFLTVWNWSARFSLAGSKDPLTLSDRILMGMLAFYLWKPLKNIGKYVKLLFLFMGTVGILATGVRKTFLVILIMLIINSYYSSKASCFNRKRIFNRVKKVVFLIGIIIVGFFILNRIPTIRDGLYRQFEEIIERTFSGIYSYVGKETTDISAMTRVINREYVFDRWFNEDGLFQILFGHGYIETYVDVPIIQIFSDLGVGLGVVYVFYSVILPIKWLLDKTGTEDVNIRLLKLMAAPILINQFVSGVPYGYRLWLPMTYLLALVDVKSHKLGSTKENKI